MGIIIYPGKIREKLSRMDSELDKMMEKIILTSQEMEKVNTEELSGAAWGNTREYITVVQQPVLQSYRLWAEYEKEGNSGYRNAGDMLPEVMELNQDVLRSELEKWQDARRKLYDFPLGSVLNHWGIQICNQMIAEIEPKLEAIDQFLGATQNLYTAAGSIMAILQQTKKNMGKISYNPETRCYELSGVDPEWLRYIQAYSKYRGKRDKIQQIYEKLNPFEENGEINWEKIDWNVWLEMLNKIHLGDLDKFEMSEEEIIAATMVLDKLKGNIWGFIEEAEKHGVNVAYFFPFGKVMIAALQHGGEKAVQGLSKPEIESKLWNFLNKDGELTSLLGFDYAGTEKDYYVTLKNSVQSKFGFMDFYDEAGSLLGMDLDDEIITFQYGEREYRIELWKGNYGFDNAFGGEFGIYYRDISDAIANPYVEDSPQSRYTLYQCLNDEEQFRTVQYIYDKRSKNLVLRNDTGSYVEEGKHYWNLVIKTEQGYDKDRLYTKYQLYLEDEGMIRAIQEALNEKRLYNEIVEENGVTSLEFRWEG